MNVKTKLLLSYALAGVGVLLAGTSGAWPLWQLAQAGDAGAPAVTASTQTVQAALKMATLATCLAALVTIVVGFIAARSISKRLSRFRRDADALVAGKGEPLRISGTEDPVHTSTDQPCFIQ